MSRFNNYGLSSQHASNNKSPNGFTPPSLKTERQDERASHSGSEDGNYALYNDQHKIDADIEEEPSTALTSQTLNADGTPKRPMNAFMIFARRRRPQVSAENQAMRTGEISKILSKEWVSMPPSEKQFYLEQAKQLKETFNTKYPDYVYRRRPNNSRKRRRSDSGSMRPGDQALMGDQPEDMPGPFDLDGSPTDGDVSDHLDNTLPSPYSRSSQDGSQNLIDHKYNLNHPRTSLGHHPYHASEPPYRSNGHGRLSYSGPSNTDRVGPSMGPSTSPRVPIGDMQYPYSQNQNGSHSQSPSVFGADSVGSHQGWQPRGNSWLGGNQDRLPTPIGTHKSSPYSSPTSWSPTETSTTTNSQSNSSNFFPTLNTPFYPNQPHVPHFQSSSSSSASHSISPHSSSSPSFDTLAGLPSGSLSRTDYTPRGYSSSGSLSSAHNSYPPPPTVRDPVYPQRTLPPVQTISSSYSHSQPPSSSSSGHSNAAGFWRD